MVDKNHFFAFHAFCFRADNDVFSRKNVPLQTINFCERMYYRSIADIFFSDACLTLILAGVFCAAIRWLHVCHPYGGRLTDYYYPARRQMTFFFAATVLLLPYVLHPSDAATWTYVRVFGVVYFPACFAMLLRRYFDRHSLYRNPKGFALIVLPLALVCALAILSQVAGGRVSARSAEIFVSYGAVGILLLAYLTVLTLRLKARIDKYHYDNFSCELDFPFKFAERVLYTPLIWCLVMWVVLITGNQWLKFVVDIAFATWSVWFLAVILHPQRTRTERHEAVRSVENMNVDEKETVVMSRNDSEDIPESKDDDADAEKENVRHEVTAIIERMYRCSDLTKTDVIAEVGYGRKSDAKAYLSEVGFYRFVNAYRLEHARLYRETHPGATLDEVAAAAGFRDRFALSYAKRKAQDSDRLLIGDFRPEGM